MYFTKFHLINIQKHKNLSLNLTKGLNIMHGDSGMGKTGVLRGLMWLYGEPQRSIMRDGEKKCSFAATRDDGIKIKRIKSASINRYEVSYPDKDTVTYNKVGKKIPPEIAELLGKVELEVDGDKLLLDFTKQKEPYFFLGEKGSFRMKILNKLTGCEVVDRTVHSYNRDIHGINKEQNVLESELNSNRDEANKVDYELTTKKTLLKEAKVILDEIKKLEERNKALRIAIDKDEEINCNLQELNLLKSKIKTINQTDIDNLKKLNNKVATLNLLIGKYTYIADNIKCGEKKLSSLHEINLSRIKELDIKVDKLSTLYNQYKIFVTNITTAEKNLKIKKSQQIDISALKELQNKVKTIKDSVLQLTSKDKAVKTLESQRTALKQQIEQNSTKIQELIKAGKDAGLCPNCGYKITS